MNTNNHQGRYYANGRAVCREPLQSSTGTSMGFVVCEISDGVSDDAAQELANALNLADRIEALRSGEGNTVTLVSDNPDFNGQPNAKVICNADWTDWQDREFAADTMLGALALALAESARVAL